MKIAERELRRIISEVIVRESDSDVPDELDDAIEAIQDLLDVKDEFDSALSRVKSGEINKDSEIFKSAADNLSKSLESALAYESSGIGSDPSDIEKIKEITGLDAEGLRDIFMDSMDSIRNIPLLSNSKAKERRAVSQGISKDDVTKEPFRADWEKKGWGPDDPFPASIAGGINENLARRQSRSGIKGAKR